MRVLVDTSVWIDFFNGHPSLEAEGLAQLIEDEVELLTCGVIVAEFILAKNRDIRLIVESGLLELREFPIFGHQ